MKWLREETILLVLLMAAASQCALWNNNTRNGLVSEQPDSKDNRCSNDLGCPTWFTCDSAKNCQCGDGHNYAVVCDATNLNSALMDCHCMTYVKESSATFLGSCYYNCVNEDVYRLLPKNPELLINESACSHFHRTGLLCGNCEEGHSPFALSYNLSCVKCPGGHKNWWKFILAGFVPLTLFYFVVFLFDINVTSSRLHGVTWYSQALSTPSLTRLILLSLSMSNPKLLTPTKVFLTFYTFWNLDIFRSVIPNICLNVSTLQALALDYLVAFYPFVLILVSYFVIGLYDRKITFVVNAWKPFRKFSTKFTNAHTSVIDSFATFFLLSYVKVLSTTIDLLVPTRIYQLGSNSSTLGLYYSPSVRYFGDEHLPYAIFAIVVLTLFVCVPTITLILYPFQFFQKFLSLFPFNWHFLHAFVDSVQGCYKDGTEHGTFDCRWISALILLMRLLLAFIFIITQSVMFFMYAVILSAIFVMAIVNIQPYKKVARHTPSTDSAFSILLSLIYISYLGGDIASREMKTYDTAMTLLGFLSAFVPLVYIIFLIGSWLIPKKR